MSRSGLEKNKTKVLKIRKLFPNKKLLRNLQRAIQIDYYYFQTITCLQAVQVLKC